VKGGTEGEIGEGRKRTFPRLKLSSGHAPASHNESSVFTASSCLFNISSRVN